jgi:hypothetical protein
MMNKNKEKTKRKQSQVVTFRLPIPVFEAYEKYCIEEQVYLSDLFKQAVSKALKDKERKRA